jgi:hypothetical protein
MAQGVVQALVSPYRPAQIDSPDFEVGKAGAATMQGPVAAGWANNIIAPGQCPVFVESNRGGIRRVATDLSLSSSVGKNG